jgi:multidrug resistance protein
MKRSPLIVIFTTVFIDLVGFGIVIPVLPFYAEGTIFNATPRTVGFLFASYSIMQLIFSPILGRLSDKYGRRPILFASIIGTGIGFLILGFANTLWMLFAGRILDGITGGNISTAQAYIADVTTKENRAKGMGLLGAAFGLGFIFGPAIGGILSRWGIHVPFFFAAGLCFLNSILLYFTLPETVTKDHPARQSAARGRGLGQLLQSLKDPKLGFVLSFHRGFFDHDDIVFSLHDVSLWLRRPAQRISFCLCRSHCSRYSRRVDREIGQTIWRTAAGYFWCIVFCNQPVCHPICRPGSRWACGAVDWRWSFLAG